MGLFGLSTKGLTFMDILRADVPGTPSQNDVGLPDGKSWVQSHGGSYEAPERDNRTSLDKYNEQLDAAKAKLGQASPPADNSGVSLGTPSLPTGVGISQPGDDYVNRRNSYYNLIYGAGAK